MCLLFFASCTQHSPKRRDLIFEVPRGNIFVETSKRPGGTFVIAFGLDSLSLSERNDTLEFETGVYLSIIVDSNKIYFAPFTKAINQKSTFFEFIFLKSTIYGSEIDTFLSDKRKMKLKSSYDGINIATGEYYVDFNGTVLKKGDIYGGW